MSYEERNSTSVHAMCLWLETLNGNRNFCLFTRSKSTINFLGNVFLILRFLAVQVLCINKVYYYYFQKSNDNNCDFSNLCY